MDRYATCVVDTANQETIWISRVFYFLSDKRSRKKGKGGCNNRRPV
jgi:hypothetical protein